MLTNSIKIKKEKTWANLISILRPVLIATALYFLKDYPYILATSVIIIILLDALDGIIARREKRKGAYGAFIDIACDRAVELIILFTYAYWDLIHIAIPIIFTIRGLTTDFIRFLNNKYPDIKFKTPLSIGKADNRFIRGFYGFIKLAAFSVILVLYTPGYILILITLAMNLYRGIPVIFSARSKELFKKFLSS